MRMVPRKITSLHSENLAGFVAKYMVVDLLEQKLLKITTIILYHRTKILSHLALYSENLRGNASTRRNPEEIDFTLNMPEATNNEEESRNPLFTHTEEVPNSTQSHCDTEHLITRRP